jgi:hypothetical protein
MEDDYDSITIDAKTAEKISTEDDALGRKLTPHFLNYMLTKHNIGHYGYNKDERDDKTQFILDGNYDASGIYIQNGLGEGVEYSFDDDGSLTFIEADESAKKVADAIRAYINRPKKVKKASETAAKASEPAEKASEPAAKPPPPPGPPPFRAPKPAEPAGPPPSRADRFRTMVSTASAQGQVKGGRKTRAKKEPKRKTRKAKKSTRRR